MLRHTGAMARLEVTGNPTVLQDQICHKDAAMILFYLRTESAKHSLEIKQGVDFRW